MIATGRFLLLSLCLFPTQQASADEHDRPITPRETVAAGEHDVRRYDGRTLDEWREVIKSLEMTSAAAARAVPGLIELCRDPEVPEVTRSQAASTLGRIGMNAKTAVPVLRSLLDAKKETDPATTARWAAKALALFGPLAEAATPELVNVACDPRQPVLTRRSAIEALGRIGGQHRDTIPTLLRLATPAQGIEETADLRSVREAAVDALGLVGPSASAVVPLLIRLTRDDHWPIRYRATLALSSIGPSAGVAADTLVDLALFDDVKEVRNSAIASLASIGDPGEAALRQLLTDEESGVRERAASVLGSIERLSDDSRQALLTALEDSDVTVRLNAVASLWKAGHDSELLLPVLLSALTEPERLPRMQAYRLLIDMREQADAIVPRLQGLTNDERPFVRQVAEKAIDELTQPAEDD